MLGRQLFSDKKSILLFVIKSHASPVVKHEPLLLSGTNLIGFSSLCVKSFLLGAAKNLESSFILVKLNIKNYSVFRFNKLYLLKFQGFFDILYPIVSMA